MNSIKHYNWFQFVEGCSVASCIVGSIASIVYQQLAYTSAPLAIALSLNLINRSKLQQHIRRYNAREMSEMHQAIESIQKQIQTLPTHTTDIEPIRKSLFQLHYTTQIMGEQFNSRLETQEIEQLKIGLVEVNNHLNALSRRFDVFSVPRENDVSEIESAIVNLTSQFKNLVKQVNAKSEVKAIDKLSQALSNLQSETEVQVKTLKAQLQAFDLNQINHNIAKLHQQIYQINEQQEKTPRLEPHVLEERLIEFEKKNLTTYKDHIARLISAIQQLQGDKATIEAAIANTKDELETLALRLDNQPVSRLSIDLGAMEKSITALDHRLNSLAQKFLSRSEPAAIQRIAQIVNQLQEHSNTLASSDTVDFHETKKTIANIQERLVALESFQVATIPDQLTQVQADLKAAYKQLDHQRLSQSSLAELTSAQVEGLKQEIEQLRFQTVNNFTSKIAHLQQQQEALAHQISNKNLHLEHLSVNVANLNSQNRKLRQDIDKYYTEMSQATILLDQHNIKQQLETVQKIIDTLDQKDNNQYLDALQQQITHLQELMSGYVKTEYLDNVLLDLCEVFSKQIDTVIDIRFTEFNQQFKQIQPILDEELNVPLLMEGE